MKPEISLIKLKKLIIFRFQIVNSGSHLNRKTICKSRLVFIAANTIIIVIIINIVSFFLIKIKIKLFLFILAIIFHILFLI